MHAYPVRHLAQPSALSLAAVLAATLRLTEVAPVIATQCLVFPDQEIDPLMTDGHADQWRHEFADLLRTPFLTQLADNGGYHVRQALRPLPGGTPPVITENLGLLNIVATGGGVAAQHTTDRGAVESQLSADLPLAHFHVIAGVDLASLGLGQPSASHALLHFCR